MKKQKQGFLQSFNSPKCVAAALIILVELFNLLFCSESGIIIGSTTSAHKENCLPTHPKTNSNFNPNSNLPASTQCLYNVSFRLYLRYVIYERLHNVVTTFVNECCFTYVELTFVKRFQITSKFFIT